MRVLRKGRKFFGPLFTMRMYFPDGAATARFAIVVSTKVSKNATRRNRIRRMIREWLRMRLPTIRSGDYLIQVQPRIMQVPEVEMQRAFVELLEKAHIISKE